jgi:hypothetical protein
VVVTRRLDLLGTVGTARCWALLFREPATAMRLVCIALIVAGIVGLGLPGDRRVVDRIQRVAALEPLDLGA